MTGSWISTAARLISERKTTMHFLTLAAVEIPEVQEDKELDKQIAEKLEKLKLQKQLDTKNFMLDIAIEECHSLQSSF